MFTCRKPNRMCGQVITQNILKGTCSMALLDAEVPAQCFSNWEGIEEESVNTRVCAVSVFQTETPWTPVTVDHHPWYLSTLRRFLPFCRMSTRCMVSFKMQPTFGLMSARLKAACTHWGCDNSTDPLAENCCCYSSYCNQHRAISVFSRSLFYWTLFESRNVQLSVWFHGPH